MENQEQQRRRETHAPERNPNPCPLYRKCGGCQLQNMSYPRQLHWKQELVERLLGRFHRVNPIIGMEHPYHYRNKVQAAFALDRRKQIVSGVYQASTHRVVPVESCNDASISEELKYFQRFEIVKKAIQKKFLNLDEAYVERLVEEMYPELFEKQDKE